MIAYIRVMEYDIETRDNFWFVVDRKRGRELVTVFDHETTAKEICIKVNARYPFFQSIPSVDADTPYPRPNTLIPRPYPRKVEL